MSARDGLLEVVGERASGASRESVGRTEGDEGDEGEEPDDGLGGSSIPMSSTLEISSAPGRENVCACPVERVRVRTRAGELERAENESARDKLAERGSGELSSVERMSRMVFTARTRLSWMTMRQEARSAAQVSGAWMSWMSVGGKRKNAQRGSAHGARHGDGRERTLQRRALSCRGTW